MLILLKELEVSNCIKNVMNVFISEYERIIFKTLMGQHAN